MTLKIVPIFLSGDRVVHIAAGPTRLLPEYYKLVRCAAEIPVSPDRVAFDIATEDFTPFKDAVLKRELPNIIAALGRGEPLYVGCMGGIGRTGTFLSILAAQHPGLGADGAVDYIRAIYNSRAVETDDQRAQVRRLAGLDLKPKSTVIGLAHIGAVLDATFEEHRPPARRDSWLRRAMRRVFLG